MSELRTNRIVPRDGLPAGSSGGIIQLKSVTHTEFESQSLTGSGNFFDIAGMTVEEIADEIGKTVRGVKTMLTRRGLQCANYNGAAKKEIG